MIVIIGLAVLFVAVIWIVGVLSNAGARNATHVAPDPIGGNTELRSIPVPSVCNRHNTEGIPHEHWQEARPQGRSR